MLNNFFWNKKNVLFFKFGFYIDFFFKKNINLFLKKFLTFSNYLFGEKYIIEFFTLKIINFIRYFFLNNKELSKTNYNKFILFLFLTLIYFFILFFFILIFFL